MPRVSCHPRSNPAVANNPDRTRVSVSSERQDEDSMALAARIGYRSCYMVGIASGTVAARLASDFRALGTAGPHFAPLAVLLQLTVLACWLVVRPISLTAFAGCFALAPRLGTES
jgi:hypothetical protein